MAIIQPGLDCLSTERFPVSRSARHDAIRARRTGCRTDRETPIYGSDKGRSKVTMPVLQIIKSTARRTMRGQQPAVAEDHYLRNPTLKQWLEAEAEYPQGNSRQKAQKTSARAS